MPEISRFFGLIIRMFCEPAGRHHRPHFHVYFQDRAAVYGIDPIEILAGDLPQRERRLVEAWAELHRLELMEDWTCLANGRKPHAIEPLK